MLCCKCRQHLGEGESGGGSSFCMLQLWEGGMWAVWSGDRGEIIAGQPLVCVVVALMWALLGMEKGLGSHPAAGVNQAAFCRKLLHWCCSSPLSREEQLCTVIPKCSSK